MSAGRSVFVPGHFGEWLQGRVGPEERIALTTLACPVAGVRVAAEPAETLAIEQDREVLDGARCRRFLEALGLPARARLRIEADLPPGGGAGLSTAALVAIARALGAAEDGIAAACLAVEGATDPLMTPRPDALLWAPRDGRPIAAAPPPPEAEVVGAFWGPPLRTDPSDRRFPRIDDLVAAWMTAPALPEAARLASQSADRTTALRGPRDDPTSALAHDLGALGVARAHTGSARALIFAPGAAPRDAEATLLAEGFTEPLRFHTGGRP